MSASKANGPGGDEPVVRRRGRPRNVVPSDEYQSKRDEVITVATDVFRQRGYDAGSLDDVAAAIDLRKASLYYYVKSKADLLRLIFDRAISRSLDQIGEYAAIEDPRQRLAALVRHQALTVASDPALFSVFFDQRGRLKARDLVEIRAKERAYVRYFIEAVEDAMAAGVLPPGDSRMMADALIGLASWVYKWFDPERDDPERYADMCVGVLLHDR